MGKWFIYIFCLVISAVPCYADEINVSTSKTQDLDFGGAVMLSTTGTVGIRSSDGEPIWLRCMNSNSSKNPTVGQIEFSSPMTDGYDVLVIKPELAQTELNINHSGCKLSVKNLILSANSKNLTTTEKSQSFNIGGTLEISGFCASDYEYSGEVNINYSIEKQDTTQLKVGSITLPVKFNIEKRADILKDTDMSFGKILSLGGAGTVVLSPLGEISSISEGLRSLGGQTGGQISIFGTPNMEIKGVDYLSSIQICLDGNANSNCMRVDISEPLPGRTFSLNESKNNQGYKMLHFGGTLYVEENQPAGEYSGQFNVTISY